MLGRVQRELSTVHPLSLYRKQNIGGQPTKSNRSLSQSFGFQNGCALTSVTMEGTAGPTNIGAKRRIQKIINEVKERREMRERKKSELQGLNGSDIDLDQLYDPEYTKRTKYYKEKLMVYNFLNSPQSFWARSYHIVVFILVFACLIVTVFSNIDKFKSNNTRNIIYLFEKIIIIWFSFEFILRLWSSSCKRKYEGWKGKVSYLSVPAHILDVIIILATFIIVFVQDRTHGSEVFAVSAVRGFHRFFSVLQIVTLNRQLQPWKVLSSVIYDQREQLFIIFYIEFIVLCILAYISYIVEKDENDQFDNIAEAMWWSVVTLSTVGYGDRVPATWLGKLISSIFTVLGVAIFALPAGIIGAGLALKVEEEERNRQRKKKKNAAATLIQCTWRCYKANIQYNETSHFFSHKPTDNFKFHYFERIEKKFITLTKFFIAKQRFIELLRPLDIKSIIESYKYGQLDVMSRVSHMQNTIDTIGTRVGLNETYIQSSQSNINSKIERIQNLVEDIEHKVNKQNAIIDDLSAHPFFDHQFIELLNNFSKNGTQKESCKFLIKRDSF